jgi:glycosyltransferase involved in cell wall biosynthesis
VSLRDGPAIPSGGVSRGRRVRLLALVAVRDEMRFLPGFLASVGPQVDGIVALDDGSTDGSAELLASSPWVIEVLRNPPDRPTWDEAANHRALVAAGLRHGAEWLVVVDADERLELEFRVRAERVIRRTRPFGLGAFGLWLRELWDEPGLYRADGVWGRKGNARLFKALPDHDFDDSPLHAQKAPRQARRVRGRYPRADLVVYHLRMLEEDDRIARRQRYEALDPEARWQPGLGYAYLTDTTGMRLRPVPRRRGYLP